jgi:hypothetical protein
MNSHKVRSATLIAVFASSLLLATTQIQFSQQPAAQPGSGRGASGSAWRTWSNRSTCSAAHLHL